MTIELSKVKAELDKWRDLIGDDIVDAIISNLEEEADEDEPQIDCFFRNPTAEEMKSVRDYIDSISVPTGVNVFDLMDELQIERKNNE